MAIGKGKITLRFDVGFGLVLLLMAAIVLTGGVSFSRIGAMNRHLVDRDWASAAAVSTVAIGTSTNANETMKLIIASERDGAEEISKAIAANVKAIDDALATLQTKLDTAQAQTLFETIKQQRFQYIASLNDVKQLHANGKREAAIQKMLVTTLPALSTLQQSIRELSALQDAMARSSSTDTHREIESAYKWMLALGLLALTLGLGCGYWIRQSLACPYACCER